MKLAQSLRARLAAGLDVADPGFGGSDQASVEAEDREWRPAFRPHAVALVPRERPRSTMLYLLADGPTSQIIFFEEGSSSDSYIR